MSKPNTLLALLLVAVLGTVAAAPASAASGDAIIRDCSNSDTGLLKGTYSKSELRAARKLVRGDIAEYTGCYDAIEAALRARPRTNDTSGGGGNGSDTSDGGGGGVDSGAGATSSGGTTGGAVDSATAASGGAGRTGGGATDAPSGTADGSTPAPTTPAPTTQRAGRAAPVELAGATITPGFGATADPEARALPTPLIAFLVLLAAGAIGVAAPTIGRRVLARRRG
ncbi:hypothetical protein [Conexibacter sp. CPCC 206217]|uniref:hypothetical protein n=1 Tax=Conexibacter sp. CPCC 206217 TaxID=3064574 RepID=UPI0027200985|nr:hypothetical protein [Conexibacter sp. CPCC 206217]MDO8210030.1 hypothetical protein [Conexibacter sp. CPCC 206217]